MIRRFSGRAVAADGLLGSLVIATLVRLPHLRFVPIWDGRNYWDDCVQPALLKPFDPLAFNCFGHRSMLYILSVSWPQYFSHGSALLLNLAHLGLSLLTIYAFYRVAKNLFAPGDEPGSGVPVALLTFVFASMPVWTSASINLNPDSGVLVGFLFALAFMLEGRLVAASLAGVFLVCSKEIGLLVWGAIAGLDVLFVFFRTPRGERVRQLLRRSVFLLPPIVYWATGAALRARELPTTWVPAARQSSTSLLWTFLTFDPTSAVFGAYAADLFVLNFSWVMTIFIAAWLVAVLVAILRKRPIPIPAAIHQPRAIFIAFVAPAVAYLVTRYPTFNNPRYLLPAFPMIVIVFGIAVTALVPRRAFTAAGILLAAGSLQLVSMSRTVDPVSRFIFGTFPFGEHEILEMTSRTGECCGAGRDQLVYNLEFTHFDYVQNALFEKYRPRDQQVIAIPYYAKWYLQGPLDARTYHRTLRNDGVIRPRYLTVENFRREPLPDRLQFIAYPNVDNRELRLFARAYEISRPIIFDEHGYRIALFDMRRRIVTKAATPQDGGPAR